VHRGGISLPFVDKSLRFQQTLLMNKILLATAEFVCWRMRCQKA
jgi:hypothetical protein